jgi:MoxR-like ATPase
MTPQELATLSGTTSTPSPEEIESQAAAFRDCFAQLQAAIGSVFVGQRALVDHLLLCFFCQGHALIEGSPGVGKTLLVRTLSDVLNLRFARIQCTPDLMPADVTGTNLLVERPDRAREFVFQRGPIFANVVLADELNRATPRTQSAFLEAMQERHVTVFGATHAIEEPFSVFATQNPIEMEGTYPLPEAQLDRFFFKLKVAMPTVDELIEIVARTTGPERRHATSRFSASSVRDMMALVKHIKVADPALRLVLRLVRATRSTGDDPGRQSGRDSRRPVPRRGRGYPCGRSPRAQSPHHSQLPGRNGAGVYGIDPRARSQIRRELTGAVPRRNAAARPVDDWRRGRDAERVVRRAPSGASARAGPGVSRVPPLSSRR